MDTHDISFNRDNGWAIFVCRDPKDGISREALIVTPPDDEGQHMMILNVEFGNETLADGSIADSGFVRYYPLSAENGYVEEYGYPHAGVSISNAEVENLDNEQLDDPAEFNFSINTSRKGAAEIWPPIDHDDVTVLDRLIDPMIDWRA